MPNLAVGVPCFNEANYIDDCLQSIAKNDLNDVEILISDNSSDDGTDKVIESFLEKLPDSKTKHFRFHKWSETVNASENWKQPFFASDSKFFMWIGGHDAITENFFSKCLKMHDANPEASLVSGRPLAMNSGSTKLKDLNVSYNFGDPNPLKRYLKSINELGDCTIIHSIFKRSAIDEFTFPLLGSADHILISNMLWHGTLAYCGEAGYLRRYFDNENRKAKAEKGYYLNDQNKVLFFAEYMKNFTKCSEGLYPEEIAQHIKNLVFNTLCQRFGLPNTLATAFNPLLKVA